ncbi:FtsX-like permease family protein [Roseivirga pacifica]|uniref:FtsX-like permease family protein n=1 Tax=Roseivirga pacifica TaxID=1267423 RepID=UPI003BB1B2AE
MADQNPLYQPPKLAERILSLCCKGRLLEEIEGDLFEYYQIEREERSKFRANINYWFHLLNFLRPFALKKLGQNSNTIIMYRSYLKFAWRGMMRQKLQTGFHLLGLILAFTVCGFIYLHVQYETSYDKHHQHADDIYRIAFMNSNPQTRTPHPMAQAMVNDFPEVKRAVTLSPIYGPGMTKQPVILTQDATNVTHEVAEGYFADTTFFDVFSYEPVFGNPKDALTKEWAVVLSESTAKRFFGEEDPIGQRLSFNGMVDLLEVAAVVKDAPKASHFRFNFMLSYVTLKTLPFNDPWLSWDDFGHFNYVQLQSGADAEALEAKIPGWITTYLNWSGGDLEALQNGDDRFALQPIRDIHLHSNLLWELEANGSYTYLLIYGVSAIFILLISIINFVNLSTAKAAQRLKEIGVKKTLGANRREVFNQFMTEAFVTTFLALVLAVPTMIWLELPFNRLVDGNIEVQNLWTADAVLVLFGITVFTAIVSALYPSFYLNSFEAGSILRGLKLSKLGGSNIRNGLLAVQLVAAILMISGSLIIKNQIEFINSKDLGFEKENLMVMDISGEPFGNKIETLKTALAAVPGISGASAVSNVPGGQFNQHSFYLEAQPDVEVDSYEMFADENAAKVLGIDVLQGRMLDKAFAADSAGTAFVLNETAIKALGVEDAVGKPLVWAENDNKVKGTIVGVVKDFNYNSLHVPIRPLIMMVAENNYNYLVAKVSPQNLQATIVSAEKAFKEVMPEVDFSFRFLDGQIEDLYREEARTLRLTIILSTISIFLACGGLLGIISIVIKQRIKEISIRKVLGASARQILWLVNFKYLLIALLSLALAVPISIYLMKDWLSNFTYQAGISPLVYGLTALGVVLLIGMTISAISMRVIRANPAQTLRTE